MVPPHWDAKRCLDQCLACTKFSVNTSNIKHVVNCIGPLYHLLLAVYCEINIYWVKTNVSFTIDWNRQTKKLWRVAVTIPFCRREHGGPETFTDLLRSYNEEVTGRGGNPLFLTGNWGLVPWHHSCSGFRQLLVPAALRSLPVGAGAGSWRDHLSAGTALSAQSSRRSAASRRTHSCNLNEQCAKPLKTQFGLSFYCQREEMQSWGAHV